jgi:hypothetical protein
MHADYLFYFFKLFFLLNISFKNAVMLSNKKKILNNTEEDREKEELDLEFLSYQIRSV